jgi:hypothetical protein
VRARNHWRGSQFGIEQPAEELAFCVTVASQNAGTTALLTVVPSKGSYIHTCEKRMDVWKLDPIWGARSSEIYGHDGAVHDDSDGAEWLAVRCGEVARRRGVIGLFNGCKPNVAVRGDCRLAPGTNRRVPQR